MVENTPYYQGKLDYAKGKESAPNHYNREEKIEWIDGWLDAQDEKAEANSSVYMLLEPEGGSWVNVAPQKEFTNVAQAEKYARDEELFDCIIVKFEKFV